MKDSLTDRLVLFSSRSQWQQIRQRLWQGGLTSLLIAVTVGMGIPTASQVTPPSGAVAPTQTGASVQSDRPILQLGSQGENVTELQALLKLLGYYNGVVDGVYQASTASAVSAFQQAAGLPSDGIVGIATWNRLLPDAPAVSTTTATRPPAPTTPNPATPAPTPTASTTGFPNPTRPRTAVSPSPTPTRTATPTPSPSPSPSRPANTTPPRTTTPAANSSSSAETLPILRVGAEGPDVERLQQRLQARGFYQGAIDGVFGPATESAVQDAQRRYNLEPDGVVGPATWAALLR